MELNKTNTTPEQPLITEADIPRGNPDLSVVSDKPGLIEIPESIRAKALGDMAEVAVQTVEVVRGGRFNSGVIPIENPGPQAINQAVTNGSFPAENVRR